MYFHRKSVLIAGILTLSLILSGCIPIVSSELSVDIRLQEAWTFEVALTPQQGYEADVANALNDRFGTQEELKSKGVTLDIAPQNQTSEGYTPVKATLKGKGYDLLNEFLGASVITADNSTGQNLLYFDLDLGSDFATFPSTFTLSGGKILSHNGTQVNDTTVVWNNYTGSMQATMVEPSLLDYWLYAAIAVILVMVILFILLLMMGLSRSSKAKKMKAQPIVRSKTCIQCGNTIPAHAVFCPGCGAQQK
jgi:hypothetical protein